LADYEIPAMEDIEGDSFGYKIEGLPEFMTLN
jgi:hypothetical protein